MQKNINIIDRNKSTDSAFIRNTNVKFFVPGTDELIFEKSNKVILSGSIFTASKHFNLTPAVRTPSYNTVMDLENTVVEDPGISGLRREEKVILFAVGTDGCGPQADQVFDVDYKKWIEPESLVPFRYPLLIDDISIGSRDVYFGRKIINDRVAYYFKTFEVDPIFIQRFKNGTPITENIYTSTSVEPVESIVELKLKITKEECREWFIETIGLNSAVVNTISLLTGWVKIIDGIKYYQDIRPLTKINIPNEYLSSLDKGMDIIYHIYY